MSERPLHDPTRATPAVREAQAKYKSAFVQQVRDAIAQQPVLVVGMGWNPHVGRARRLLDAAGIAHHDLDHGNYLTGWRERLAVKLMVGWPTFPMVFVKGVFVGGASDLDAALRDGTVQRLLDGGSV
jgi:glutaredoxin-related protein